MRRWIGHASIIVASCHSASSAENDAFPDVARQIADESLEIDLLAPMAGADGELVDGHVMHAAFMVRRPNSESALLLDRPELDQRVDRERAFCFSGRCARR